MSLGLMFIIFFKVGLFTVGGGLASLGLLHEYLVEPGYISSDTFYNMFAVSQSTPGPIGVNMATFVGFEYGGILGAIIATFALVLPSLIIITAIVYSINNFNNNKYIKGAFSGFRPAAIGIIASVAYYIFLNSIIDFTQVVVMDRVLVIKASIFACALFLTLRYNFHPILCIVGGAVIAAALL